MSFFATKGRSACVNVCAVADGGQGMAGPFRQELGQLGSQNDLVDGVELEAQKKEHQSRQEVLIAIDFHHQ